MILRKIPANNNGIAILYKLIPDDFIAVHSFRFAIKPMLKTVAIRVAIGNPILKNQGNV